MKRKILTTIRQNELFQQEGLILVALSGGADSVALLLVLKELGYSLHALHCNFHLRGEESDRDEQFVTQLCQRLSIPISIQHFDTKSYAQEQKTSIETAARDLRYQWFQEKLDQYHAQAIAVAHHQDDQAETILLNIIRGTGIKGLTGMKLRNGNVCRPMLNVTKKQILSFLSERGQDYVTDSTNLQRDARRNKVRLDVLPMLKEINPNIVNSLVRLSENANDYLATYHPIEENFEEDKERQSSFTTKEATLSMLHDWAGSAHFNRTQLQNILQARTGAIIQSHTHRLLKDREFYFLQPVNGSSTPLSLQQQILPFESLVRFERDKAYLDASKVKLPLKLRPYQSADRFTPFGMKGSKTVSKHLTDLKLNRFERERQQVVVDADERIVWLPPHCIGNGFQLTPDTREILLLELNTHNNNK